MNIQKTMENLSKNGIESYLVQSKEDIINQFCQLVPKGSSVGIGGSMSVEECGLLDHIKNGDYNFVERNVTEDTDFYLCSSNAVTENGELYNVDGRSNRVSNIAYGPKNVIMVVGINKIVEDLPAAVNRVKTVAAPKNCVRLNMNTYCKEFGKCKSLNNPNSQMTDGCGSPDRICCNFLVSAKQRVKGRIKVIFVNESLGY